MLPSGILTEVFAIERPAVTRNAAGESVTTWQRVRTVFGSYEALSYQATVRIHHVPDVDGTMRLVWLSRSSRILMIAGVVEKGRREELELAVEEQAT